MNGTRSITAVSILSLASVASAEVGRYEPGRDPTPGINLWNVRQTPQGEAAWVQQIDAIHAAGFKRVTVIPQLFVNNSDATLGPARPVGSIGLDHTQGRNFGMTDGELRATLDRAKHLGLQATVTPFVQHEGFQFVFRGETYFEPGTPAAQRFWDDYVGWTDHYATIAQQHGASAYVVGSELRNLDVDGRNEADWNRVLSAADTRFAGPIGYNAVHADYDDPGTVTNLWSNPKLDFVSVSGYFPVASDAEARGATDVDGHADLVHTRMREAFDSDDDRDFVTPTSTFGYDDDKGLVQFASDLPVDGGGRRSLPVVLGEVGIVPLDGMTHRPYSFELGQDTDGKFGYDNHDADEALAYLDGLLAATDGRAGEVAAMDFWTWGWQGGFAGENFFINPNQTTDLLDTALDEREAARVSAALRAYMTAVPEPASAAGIIAGIAVFARRRR